MSLKSVCFSKFTPKSSFMFSDDQSFQNCVPLGNALKSRVRVWSGHYLEASKVLFLWKRSIILPSSTVVKVIGSTEVLQSTKNPANLFSARLFTASRVFSDDRLILGRLSHCHNRHQQVKISLTWEMLFLLRRGVFHGSMTKQVP